MTYYKSAVPSETRRAVKERAAGACERCGARGENWTGARAFLSIHHTVPERAGGDHSIGNLEALCKTCHDAAHAKGAEASLSAYKTGMPRGKHSWKKRPPQPETEQITIDIILRDERVRRLEERS